MSLSPNNSLRFQSTTSRFLSYRLFWDKCTDDLNMALKTLQGQVYPINVLLVSKSPKCHPVRPKTSCFSVTGHWFEKCAPNDSKMTLNPTNVPYICVIGIRESQILVRFGLRPTVVVKKSALNGPKRPTSSNVPPYMCYQYPRVPNFTPIRSTVSRFWVTGHLKKSAPNDPYKNTIRSNVPHMCY